MMLQNVIRRGTRASQPAATAVSIGTLYCVTDEGLIIERSNGTTWDAYSGTGSAIGGSGVVPMGRLTLTTAIPFLVSSVTAATTIYYTPAVGNVVPLYNGTVFVPTVFGELSQ